MKTALGFGVVILLSALPAWGQCPSADSTRDCFVDLADFAVLAGQWLTEDPGKEIQDLALLASQWLTGQLPDDIVQIPGGTFQMGNGKSISEGYSDERPVHTVTLDSFAIGKYEITNGQYCAFLKAAYPSELKVVGGTVYASSDSFNRSPYCDTGHYASHLYFSNNTFRVLTKSGRDMSNDPMILVSWYGAVAYCNWRSRQESREECYDLSTWACDFSKQGYRLPTEAEWEFAARGGVSNQRFPWGDTIIQSQANYYSYWSGGKPFYPYDLNPTEGYSHAWNDDRQPYTSPVGSFSANGFGLYDMAGNVIEWCHNWADTYTSSSQTNPTGAATGTNRLLRGGSWSHYADECRVSCRNNWTTPKSRGVLGGFRVVLKP